MKSVKWIAIIIVTFFAGYFTHATVQGKTSAQKEKIEPTFKYVDENKSDSLIPATEFPQIAKTEPTAKHAGKASSQDNKGKAAIEKYPSPTDDTILIDAPTDGDNQNRKGYGDEKIVTQMPAPFDQLLTKIEGPLREKFKDYADTDSNQKDDWDQRMQSQLTDFILSRPSATDIRIHLINVISICAKFGWKNKSAFYYWQPSRNYCKNRGLSIPVPVNSISLKITAICC